MKTAPNTPAKRAQQTLAVSLAAMLSASAAIAQTAPAAPATEQSKAAGQDAIVLSPFEVRTDKDYGYLRTNSVSATRIGTEIQSVPLNITVVSEDFIKDTGMSDLQDVLRYVAGSAGDTKMGLLQPATGATPSGNISLRGFPLNSRLRNGILRYNGYNLDTVDRVEIIQGPAAVFFGQGYPGGVINYVTKKPVFSKIPTTVSYGYGGVGSNTGSQRATLDHNTAFGDKAAMRFVAAWDNRIGDANFEFQKGHTFAPSLALVPFESGKLRINLEMESMYRTRNQDDSSWIWNEQYFKDYANPSAALITAAGSADATAYRNRIFGSYANWMADVRKVAGKNALPAYTSMERGAYYTNKSGTRIHDEDFNYYGAGAFNVDKNDVFQATVEFAPVDWLDARYAFTNDRSSYTENRSQAIPNADGMTFNMLNSPTTRDYILRSKDHQLDLVLKKKLAGLDNKLLIGAVNRETSQAYTGTATANLTGTGQYPFFANLPGAYSKPDEGYVSPIIPSMISNFVTSAQYVRDRNGKILTPVEIFTKYDPTVHPSPDITRITEIDRALVDKYRPKREDFYINYQGSALEERLHVFGGWRHEKMLANGGQMLDANAPWFSGWPNMINEIPQADWPKYNIGTYALTQMVDYKSDSYMGGVSFKINDTVTLYTSWSQTGVINGGTLGGDFDETSVRARATDLGRNPDAELARLVAQGGRDFFKPEKGLNMEVGAKIATHNNKLVGTFSLFRAERQNRKLDDTQRTLDEPLNYNATGGYSRQVRWYSNSARQRTEGIEGEVIWTPVRNYQAIINGAWLWTAETLADASLVATNINRPIVFGNRLPFAPEYRFNLFNKYTFTNDAVRGLSVGLGVRYSSEMIIGNDTNYNASLGGLTAGDYIVFDGLVSYPWELYGYQMVTALNISNLTDKDYSEGGANLSPRRSWMLTTTLKF